MTIWTGSAADLYKLARHGSDGARLLDQKLTELLRKYCNGVSVIDAGCGPGRFSVDALNYGASSVFAVDSNPRMIDHAIAQFVDVDPEQKCTTAIVGDVTVPLKKDANSFGVYLSINVVCNLDSAGLPAMFKEAFRLLQSGGHMIVTLPANLDILFLRDEADPVAVRTECNRRLIETDNPQSIVDMGEIFRGTIVGQAGGYRLAEFREEVPDGTPIYRKLAGINRSTGLVVTNYWHDPEAYLQACSSAGFQVIEDYDGKFNSEEERVAWNESVPETDRIGLLTVGYSVFKILVLRKP